jgi:hypothetical protein
MGTKYLAKITQTFVFFNLGTVLAVIIALLVKTDVKNSVRLPFQCRVDGILTCRALMLSTGLLHFHEERQRFRLEFARIDFPPRSPLGGESIFTLSEVLILDSDFPSFD